MKLFKGSSNKDTIRQTWDLFIIEAWYKKINRPLRYFGLPGPQIHDLLDWRTYLGYCTGVERLRREKEFYEQDIEAHRQIHINTSLNDFDEFQLLRGFVEDVILDGIDMDNHQPGKAENKNPLLAAFQYDLINLDFLGGIGQDLDSSGHSKRVHAIKKLLERQQKTDFLLMLTLNVRDKVYDELISYLEGAQREVLSQELKDILNWYANCNKGKKNYRLKAVVPLFIRREAERCGFDCFCYPPLSYEGTGSEDSTTISHMVHFVFSLTTTKTNFHAFSQQNVTTVVNLPFIEVHEQKFQLMKQHLNFDFSLVEDQLNFLPEETRKNIIATIPEKVLGVDK